MCDNMPVELNEAIWGALLGACKTHGNIKLGELAVNQIFKLEPKDSSPYVLLSNRGHHGFSLEKSSQEKFEQ